MAFAINDGVRIRYEVIGSGPPLLLHIGCTLGLEDWAEEGYIAALQDRYRLILIDPRAATTFATVSPYRTSKRISVAAA